MKKAIVLMFFAVMIMAMATNALADRYYTDAGESCYMEIYAHSKTDTDPYIDGAHWVYKGESADNNSIFVRHYVEDGYSTSYTNHYRGQRVYGENSSRTTVGSKWCTVGVNVPIESDAITLDKSYSVSARGNTKHYNYDGVSALTLKTNMYVNMD